MQTITDNLADGVADYLLAAAKSALASYLYAGTLPGGLQELQEDARGCGGKTNPCRLPLPASGFGIGGTAYAAGANFGIPFAPIGGHPAPILCLAWEMNCTVGDLP